MSEGWNSHVRREFIGEFDSSNVRRGNVSREIGRIVWSDLGGELETHVCITTMNWPHGAFAKTVHPATSPYLLCSVDLFAKTVHSATPPPTYLCSVDQTHKHTNNN